jgi:hypothetical protein
MAQQIAEGTADHTVIERARELHDSLTYVGGIEARGLPVAGVDGHVVSAVRAVVSKYGISAARYAYMAILDYEHELGVKNRHPCESWFHDIFGNPFRPVTFSAEWRTSTVVALARQMYDSRDFSAMPILADALQDAGCDHDEILKHCRDESAIHVRGCWVVDCILGKE